MSYFLLFLLVVVLGLMGVQLLLQADARRLAKHVKLGGMIVLFALAVVFLAIGRWGLAVPLAVAGYALYASGGLTRKTPRQGSRVRTSLIEMALDHDTGVMSGRVLAGEFEGQELDGLDIAQLARLYDTARKAGDQSADLLEAYLERAHKGWAEHDAFAGMPSDDDHGIVRPESGPMSLEEAFEALGLEKNASEADIKSAHKTLMKKVHPDVSGSQYLASKINEAKDTLLKR